jgi:hypothetical protein
MKRLMITILIAAAFPVAAQPDDGESRRVQLERELAEIDARRAEIVAELGPERDRPAFPRRPRDHAGGLQPEDRRPLLALLRSIDPDRAERMRTIFERPDDARGGEMGRMLPRLRELRELRDSDPELFEAKRAEIRAGFEIASAGERYLSVLRGRAGDAERNEAVSGLRAAVEAGFDARAGVARLMISRLETQLGQIRGRLADADSTREAKIREHVDRITARIENAAAESGDD